MQRRTVEAHIRWRFQGASAGPVILRIWKVAVVPNRFTCDLVLDIFKWRFPDFIRTIAPLGFTRNRFFIELFVLKVPECTCRLAVRQVIADTTFDINPPEKEVQRNTTGKEDACIGLLHDSVLKRRKRRLVILFRSCDPEEIPNFSWETELRFFFFRYC